ncbi:MAG: lysylphosphatidylglycerol synthase transmembrane domain-containing protein [Aggregatilineales bacterium]
MIRHHGSMRYNRLAGRTERANHTAICADSLTHPTNKAVSGFMRKYQRLLAIGLGLGLLAFIAVTLLSDVSQLVKFALAFPWLIMLPILALRVGNWGTRFVKWYYYLRLVGVKGLSIKDALITFISGLAMAASPGKVAEILKCFIIRNLTGTPIATTIPTVIAERLTDGMAVLLLMVWSIAELARPEYMPVVAVSLAAIVIGVVILTIRPLCIALLNVSARLPLIGKFATHFRAFYESSYQIVQLPNLIFGVSTGLIGNLLDGLGVFLILIALGRPATAETFFDGLLAISFSVVTGSISGSPGGIGASDLTITGVLQKVAGLSVAEAGFATLLARFVQLWWGVLAGLTVAFMFRARLFPPSLETVIAESQGSPNVPSAITTDTARGII